MRLFTILLSMAICIMACSKADYEQGKAFGGLSFYNASFTLDTWLSGNAGNRKKIFLPLMQEGKPNALSAGKLMPFFSEEAGFSGDTRRHFPATVAGNAIPWIVFEHYTPGNYEAAVRLNSTEAATEFRFTAPVEDKKAYTCFLSDSLGTFHATTIAHEPGVSVKKIKFRLIQLCPDADSVNVRIGNNVIAGLKNIPYQSSSAYVEYPLATDSTLKIRLFNAGDTLSVIGRTDLVAQPGQSYLLIIRNYRHQHQYTDSKGNTVNVIPNVTLDTRKVE